MAHDADPHPNSQIAGIEWREHTQPSCRRRLSAGDIVCLCRAQRRGHPRRQRDGLLADRETQRARGRGSSIAIDRHHYVIGACRKREGRRAVVADRRRQAAIAVWWKRAERADLADADRY